jgi:hypothetical protein
MAPANAGRFAPGAGNKKKKGPWSRPGVRGSVSFDTDYRVGPNEVLLIVENALRGGQGKKTKLTPHLGGQHGRHAFAFHRRRLLDLGYVDQFLQDHIDDPSSLFDVLQLAASEQHVDQDLILVFEELACLVNLGVDVVVAGLGTDADFLQLLLVNFRLGPLARLLVTEFAVVQNLANRRALGRSHFDEVEIRFARQFHCLGSRNDAELFAVDADKPHRTDADLLVDPLAPVVVSALSITITVRWGNTSISCYTLERPTIPRYYIDDKPALRPALVTGIIFLVELASQLPSRSLMIRDAADPRSQNRRRVFLIGAGSEQL